MEYPGIDLDLSEMGRADYRWPGLRLGQVRALEGRACEVGGELGVQTEVHPAFGQPERQIDERAGRLLTWEETRGRTLTESPNLLRDFVQLSNLTKSRLARFLTKYGALPLCSHGKARGHKLEGVTRCEGPYPRWHAATVYQRLAEEAGAMLTASAALHQGRISPGPVWRLVQRTYMDNEEGPRPRSQGEAKAVISYFAMETWMDRGGLGLRLDWELSDPALFLGSTRMDLWAALGRALLLAVLAKSRFERCAHCGDLFQPKHRRRREGVSAWCLRQECRREKSKQSSDRYRRNLKSR
jgi:hypothetical protein